MSDSNWVSKRSEVAVGEKRVLARYAAEIVEHGDDLILGSGTTLTALMYELVSLQAERGGLDLQVLTSNLQVLGIDQAGLQSEKDPYGILPSFNDAELDRQERLERFVRAFRASQIILSGGVHNRSLDALVGEGAVAGICDPNFFPTIVFFGAKGLSFQHGLTMAYQFMEEIPVQESYAKRPTHKRVILCDHTKLGNRQGRKAAIDVDDLLAEADECVFISTLPSDAGPALDRVQLEAVAFEGLCQSHVKSGRHPGKHLTLELVNPQGVLARSVSTRQATSASIAPARPALHDGSRRSLGASRN